MRIGIGPWLFRLMWTPTPEPSPPDRAIPLDEAALAARYSQIVQHSRQLAESRAELREQRRIQLDAIATLRSRIEEQLAEATSLQREAVAGKAQLKTLASRFMRRMKRKWLATRQELNAERAELDRQRQTLMSAAHNLQLAWSKVHTREAAQRDCVRDAWVAIETSQRRASEEWSETNAYFQEQNALLNQRTIRISERESSVNQRSAQASQEIKRLLQEATGLEARRVTCTPRGRGERTQKGNQPTRQSHTLGSGVFGPSAARSRTRINRLDRPIFTRRRRTQCPTVASPECGWSCRGRRRSRVVLARRVRAVLLRGARALEAARMRGCGRVGTTRRTHQHARATAPRSGEQSHRARWMQASRCLRLVDAPTQIRSLADEAPHSRGTLGRLPRPCRRRTDSAKSADYGIASKNSRHCSNGGRTLARRSASGSGLG